MPWVLQTVGQEIEDNIAWSLVQDYLKVDTKALNQQQLAIVDRARNGDLDALNTIGKALSMDKRTVFGEPDTSLAAQFFFAAAQKGHVRATYNLGNAFAQGKGTLPASPKQALHWFSLAAEANDPFAAYNCGILLAKGSDLTSTIDSSQLIPAHPLLALENLQRSLALAQSQSQSSDTKQALLAAQVYSQASLEKLMVETRTAIDVLCDTIAHMPLDVAAMRRLWTSSSISSNSINPNHSIYRTFTAGLAALAEFNVTFAATQGAINAPAIASMTAVVNSFGSLVDQHTSLLSPLQTHMLLNSLQDMLGPLSGKEASSGTMWFTVKAAVYAEAFAMSFYCRGRYAAKETDAACFNGAASAAVSYYRRLAVDGEHDQRRFYQAAAERVFNAARDHSSAATRWQRLAQTPRVYHPGLTAKPWWDAHSFQTVAALRKLYSEESTRADLMLQLSNAQKLFEGGLRKSVPTDSQTGQIGLQRVFTPYIGVGSSESAETQGAGPWAEFGPLFDGVQWLAACDTVPLLCETLKQPMVLSELCGSSIKATVSPSDGSVIVAAPATTTAFDIEAQCGADTIVTILRLKPGAHIKPHCGTTNRRLIMHFALQGSEGVQFRVGDDTCDGGWREYGGDGNGIVFDDSFEHEVRHSGTHDRFVVLAVLKHPESGLSPQ